MAQSRSYCYPTYHASRFARLMPRPRSRVRFHANPGLTPARLTPRVIPSVDPWMAGEMFVSPHVEERRRGFAILCGSEAARQSALTLYLLASRVDEPDLSLRGVIVQALADYFEIREREFRYPPEMRAAVTGRLRQFDRAQIVALVELQRAGPEGAWKVSADALTPLLERVPNASIHLTRIAGDRAAALGLRLAAVEVIGHVGFTDALSTLEGLEARLEGRSAGQLTMTFAPHDHSDDQALLPALKETLRLLHEDE